jgi:hypothetical protein
MSSVDHGSSLTQMQLRQESSVGGTCLFGATGGAGLGRAARCLAGLDGRSHATLQKLGASHGSVESTDAGFENDEYTIGVGMSNGSADSVGRK